MPMLMMEVGIMRMAMHERLVNVPMRVRLVPVPFVVRVPMVLVVDVRVRVLEEFVGVLVLVPLGDVQPYAERHEHAGGGELPRHVFARDKHRDQGPDERRN